MSAGRRKAAFLDRDGVLNADRAYLYRPEDFEILPGVLPALRLLTKQRHALVVVTNQSGIARGLFAEADYERLRDHMREVFATQDIVFDGIYHCPHHPEAAVEQYRLACDCRKPAAGLLRRAAEELDLDLPRSLLVGDKASDIAAGRAAGVGRCYLVGAAADAAAPDPAATATASDAPTTADAVFPDLLRCVRTVCLGDST
jgi:D-glycero-D-manno-heptose 1,7-bisphosphate phosphatase